ncbi:MAG TPA: hypothetical protein HA254_06980 [Candidatus Diapherotrites archaeon]|uniref:Uncharacterized protein n=1 Tax=Candidatus Iainarchaeum sp. TaxID=3101447 RepID=A0A7J4IYA0_9ARCH|nr:hypothetical protein [Candidatus Diapherotrites archaeon]
MDRDKVIAIVLVVGFAFLIIALFGVAAITGYVLFFTSPEPAQAASGANDQPAWKPPVTGNVGIQSANADGQTDESQSDDLGNEEEEEPAPVCGNSIKESGEACDANSDCSSTQVCNNSCQCVDKPVERAKVEGLQIEKIVSYWCAPDFNGKKGLAAKILRFKNTGTADFTYNGEVQISAETGDTRDSVVTNSAFRFTVKAGKTLDIYGTNLARSSAPFIFLGATPTKTKLTVDFGPTKYIEYEYTLRANDFASVGCL